MSDIFSTDHLIGQTLAGRYKVLEFVAKGSGGSVYRAEQVELGRIVAVKTLYAGNDNGDESSLVTTFPVAHTGIKGRKGSGQVGYVSLSIPTAAIDYWRERLGKHGFDVKDNERFGERYLDFQHPCGVGEILRQRIGVAHHIHRLAADGGLQRCGAHEAVDLHLGDVGEQEVATHDHVGRVGRTVAR